MAFMRLARHPRSGVYSSNSSSTRSAAGKPRKCVSPPATKRLPRHSTTDTSCVPHGSRDGKMRQGPPSVAAAQAHATMPSGPDDATSTSSASSSSPSPAYATRKIASWRFDALSPTIRRSDGTLVQTYGFVAPLLPAARGFSRWSANGDAACKNPQQSDASPTNASSHGDGSTNVLREFFTAIRLSLRTAYEFPCTSEHRSPVSGAVSKSLRSRLLGVMAAAYRKSSFTRSNASNSNSDMNLAMDNQITQGARKGGCPPPKTLLPTERDVDHSTSRSSPEFEFVLVC